MNHNFKYFTFILLAAVFFTACEKKEYQTIEELDDANIQAYIQKNNLSVQEFEDTGMFYSILEEGDGAELDYEKQVPLVFTLKTLEGSYSAVDTFNVANRYYDYLGYFPYGSASANTPGSPLDKEIGMKVLLKKALKNGNGRIRIIVPSRLAFGRNGNKQIPSNASIDYEIHAIDSENVPAYEDQSILQYMVRNGMEVSEFEKTETGIYYKINDLGTGEFLQENSSIKVAYDLKFLSGKTFQKADSASLNLSSVISAWQEVMPKLKEKGKVRMLIPSPEAYGLKGSTDPNTGQVTIAPFMALDYDVEVQKLIK